MRRKLHRPNAMHFLRSAARLHQTRGFTLIELITTIVIMGILLAAAAPKFFDNRVFDEHGYADEVAAALRYASSVAVGSDCFISVTLNSTDYHVDQSPAAATCKNPGGFTMPVQRTDGGTLIGTAPTNVTLSVPTQIIFDNNGKVVAAVPPALQVGAFKITIDANSGAVTVQ
jgi:MSHA pilin protein MshC